MSCAVPFATGELSQGTQQPTLCVDSCRAAPLRRPFLIVRHAMKFHLPGQLAYETIARGPAARAQRASEALTAARQENGVAGDRWMLRLIAAGVTALACLALAREHFIPAAWMLTSIGVSLAAVAAREWRGTRGGAITLGLAAHLVGWALSVQIGSRIEWGAIYFVITTTQLRYEDASVVLPSIALYLVQHLAEAVLMHFGVPLDFLWSGGMNVATSLLASMLAVMQGSVIIEIARALTRRHEAAIHANLELADRAAQADAQSAALLRTEAIMRGVIGGSEDGVAVYDGDGRIIVWNPRMEAISGVRASSALGRLRSEVYGSDAARDAALQSALSGQPAHVNNVVFCDSVSGVEGELDIAYLPLRSADASVIGAFKVAHDVSERTRTAEAISTTRQQLLEAIEAIDAGFALFDADDRVIQVNSAYRDYYTEIADQLTPGTPYVDIARAYLTVFPEYTGGLPLDVAVQNWVAARVERANTKEYKQGDRWLLLQDRPTASGGRVSLRTDISKQKQIQREVEEARYKAEDANRAKSEFLARMSHELRTPLNSIIGFSRLVKSNKHGVLLPKDIAYLERVSRNGEHLLALINDMLDLSRIEAGRMPILIEEIDCNAMILETVRMLEGQSSQSDVRVIAHTSPRQLNLTTDAAKLRQVLINLVGNALKFTSHGTVTVSVSDAPDHPDHVVFAVSDTGIGIPEHRLQAIFDAFEQADGTTSRQYGGTGLGLTISRTLSDVINATITVDSAVGVGSTFRVTCAPMVRRATPLGVRIGATQLSAS
ncbi:MAG: PAS-domain containing protein [Gemmatimonadaceae bacterium]|nr:PAS-domain containing protein [Gemmatimonadaceae bacterium]